MSLRVAGHDSASLARFVAAGSGAALVLALLTFLLARAGIAPFAAGVAAYGLCTMAAYAIQQGWSFAGRHDHGHALPRYLAAQAVSAAVSGLAAHWFAALVTPAAAALGASMLASACSLSLGLLWVFPARGAGR